MALITKEDMLHLSTGFDFEFVDPLPAEKECTICRSAARNPVQLILCGHRYCESCLEKLVETSFSDHRKLLCPQDRTPIPTEGGWIHDQACEKEMLSLHVKCKKARQGCYWTGEMRHYYQKHIDVCPYGDVTCEDCKNLMERRFLNTHIASECNCRTVACEYCKEMLEFWMKEKHQNETCPRFPVKCSQGCGNVPREEMEFHLRDACMMTTVFCPYKEAGCTFHDKRINLITHLEDSRQEHLRDVWSKLSKTTKQLNQRETEIESLKKKVKRLEKQDDKVNDMQIENALMKNKLSQLEEGTEKIRELSKRVNELEKVQFQLQELQQETESTKTQVKELEVVKYQAVQLLTWKESMQRVMEKQNEQIMKLRASEEERETETNSLKKLVEQLQRQNDETGTFVKKELKQFMDNVVCKFEATLEKQQLNQATSPVNSTNQLALRRTPETLTEDRNCPALKRTQAVFEPDNLVAKKRRKVEEWKRRKERKLNSKMDNGQAKKTVSKSIYRQVLSYFGTERKRDRRGEMVDSDDDDFI